MILRSIQEVTPAKENAKPRPVWDALFEHQSKLGGAKECWLITQPSHSALSGEIAARLRPEVFGQMDEATTRAIALHDAGWSQSDSEQIRASRDELSQKRAAFSFLGAAAKDAVAAWTISVETALKASPLGGLLVSEHFRSIAQFQVKENPASTREMAAFARQEEARQKKLRPKMGAEDGAVERLVDGLRFTDLLSLYLCAGLAERVVLPQQFQKENFTITALSQDVVRVQPFPFVEDTEFTFGAVRHPRTKLVSSAGFLYKVSG